MLVSRALLLRGTNIGLRFASLGTRFVFVFIFAKFFDAASVGYYGLFTAAIGYSIYFVGIEFYVYATRGLLKVGPEQRGVMLKSHALLSAALYIFWLPFGVYFLSRSGWPGHLALWFFPILLLEHLNQEIFRLLVALSSQLTASVLLFVRQGSWALVSVAAITVTESGRDLDFIMASWFTSGVAAALIGIIAVRRQAISGWDRPLDWRWIRKGLLVCLPFLLATLSSRGLQTIDRYWLEALGGIDLVGSYVLFFGIASALSVFLDAGVFSYAYPKLIRLVHEKRCQEAQDEMRQVLYQTVATIVGFAVLTVLLLPYLLKWIGNPAHQQAMDLYPWILSAMSLYCLGQVPHWGLYASGRDRVVLQSHIAALASFVCFTWIASDLLGVYAVPAGLNAAYLLILVWKSLAYCRHGPKSEADDN